MIPRQMLLVLSAIFLLSFGCVTYHARAGQNFTESGDSLYSINEKLALNPNLTMGAVNPASLGGDIGPAGNRMLMRGIIDYFADGTYAKSICGRVGGNASCHVGSDGSVQINAPMQPDSRFYIFNYTRDWLALKEIRNYTISRLPLPSYFAYGQLSDSARASLQQQSLRDYLGDYVDKNIDQLPADTCIGDSPLDCAVIRKDNDLELLLSSGAGYPSDVVSHTQVMRTMCSFMTSDKFSESAYRSGDIDMKDAHDVNLTLSDIGPGGLVVPCDPGTPTLLVEVQYPPGLGIDSPYLLVYQLVDRQKIQWQLHQGLLPNGTLMTAVSQYANGGFGDQVVDFTAGQMRSHGFGQLNSTKTSEGFGADVQFDYSIQVPNGDVNGSVNGHTIDMSGNMVILDLRHLASYGSGNGVRISAVKYLSPLGPYTWLAINLIFLVIMGLVVLQGVMSWRKAPPRSKKYMDRPDSAMPDEDGERFRK